MHRFVGLCSILFLLAAGVARAQVAAGEITGTVTDATGAVVGGAAVTLTNPATNTQRTVTTNTAGVYDLPALLPGAYNLKAEMKGFTTQVRNDIELQVAQVARIDFTLQVGNVTEVVEVAGGAPVLQTETTDIGTVVENRRIEDLPLNGRNYLQLASLIPGATTNGPPSAQGQGRMGGTRNDFTLNVAGQRLSYNHYTLDGVENTDPNFNTYLLLPSLDALQEFKVESGQFQAEYGRGISQVNVSTKSGTNEIHGSAFEFLRNADLDAKNFFDAKTKPIPPFKRNQFGATVGGPVLIPKILNGKDKLFFFFDYEGLRERKALTQTATVPSAPWRVGDFSGATTTIYDPTTRVVNGAGQLVSVQPFSGNMIPASRIAPISATLLQRFEPLPNLNPNVVANNFLNTEGRPTDSNQENSRFDYVQSANSTWMFRYGHTGELRTLPINIPNMANNIDVQGHQGMLRNTRVLGANKVNEFSFAISRLESGNVAARAGAENVVAELGITGVSRDFPLYWGVPNITISGLVGPGEFSDTPFINWDTIIQWNDNFSWTTGKHSFKMGGEVWRIRYNQLGGVVPRGRFTFNGQFSNNPLISTSANQVNAMSDFLLGVMSGSEGQVGAPIANYRASYYGLYFQDNWKISPKLTMNWGLRWEDQPPYYDKHDAIVNIDFRWDNSIFPTYVRTGTGDPLAGNPAFPLPSSIPYVRDGRFGRRAFRTDNRNWAPRLGLAYQLDSKTVIRTGFGMYYVRDIGNAVFDVVRNAPFTIRRSESANAIIPNLNWGQPFTQLGIPSFILANQFEDPTPYVAQWSFGVQRQLTRDMSLEVDYLGSEGSHLQRLQSYNTAPPGPGNINARRPYPIFNGNFQVMNGPGHSSYNGLQARLQQRFSRGFTLLSSFSYSKSIDNTSGIRTSSGVGELLTPSNNYNLRAERSLSGFDFRRRSTSSLLYELPIGKGKMFLGNAGRAANALAGGWQVGTILTLQDGFPLSAFCGAGSVQNNDSGCYPDNLGVNPNLPRSQQDPSHFFNLDAFVNRLPGSGFRYGNSGRNTITGPGLIDWDFSTTKKFQFTERTNLEFRAEFFNIPNHPIFANPGLSVGLTGYGVIGGTVVDARELQFALRLEF
ncbi:MAG TPA: carboxypeptidase-like regulatory domain-containing protein [Bryobacterales bacterium]|nr:carboxypeptidase-like regulatory domain-containing protein [Bryobacterales bacterium]